MRHQRMDSGMVFEMGFVDTDPWGFHKLSLDEDEVPDEDDDGLAFTAQILQGKGTLRVQFIEEGGAHYITDTTIRSEGPSPQRTVALLKNTQWGAWSKVDPDGKLNVDRIRAILIGINAERNTTVKMLIKDLAWVRF